MANLPKRAGCRQTAGPYGLGQSAHGLAYLAPPARVAERPLLFTLGPLPWRRHPRQPRVWLGAATGRRAGWLPKLPRRLAGTLGRGAGCTGPRPSHAASASLASRHVARPAGRCAITPAASTNWFSSPLGCSQSVHASLESLVAAATARRFTATFTGVWHHRAADANPRGFGRLGALHPRADVCPQPQPRTLGAPHRKSDSRGPSFAGCVGQTWPRLPPCHRQL